MKKIFLTLGLVSIIGTHQLLAQHVEKTVSQILDDVNESAMLIINLPNVSIEKTKSNRVLVETTVRTNVPSAKILDLLIAKGRYKLTAKLIDGKNRFEVVKGEQPSVMIGGKEISETYHYKIFLPKNTTFSILENREEEVK